jgi:hypothetical protein
VKGGECGEGGEGGEAGEGWHSDTVGATLQCRDTSWVMLAAEADAQTNQASSSHLS